MESKDNDLNRSAGSAQLPEECPTLLQQYTFLKSKHPDALLMFRTGDFYSLYESDARRSSKILGINISPPDTRYDTGMSEVTRFPHHTLDTYLPRLIRAGERVAICDYMDEQTYAKERAWEQRRQAAEAAEHRGFRR